MSKKIRDEYKTPEYLLTIPLKNLEKYVNKFRLTEQKILIEARRAYIWSSQKGRHYINYHLFFNKWLSRNDKYSNEISRKTKTFEADNLDRFDKYK